MDESDCSILINEADKTLSHLFPRVTGLLVLSKKKGGKQWLYMLFVDKPVSLVD